MWAYASGGSWWVHMDAAIRVPPKINTNFVTSLPTHEEDFPINVYLSINGSSILVSVNKCVVKKRSTYRELFIPYSYSQQRHMFHISAVGVCQFIRCRFMSSLFTKQSGH